MASELMNDYEVKLLSAYRKQEIKLMIALEALKKIASKKEEVDQSSNHGDMDYYDGYASVYTCIHALERMDEVL